MQIILSLKSCTGTFYKPYSTHDGENLGGYYIPLFAGLLANGMQSEGPATGHLDTSFLGFPLF
jgi:hypothetical protein